MAVQNVYADTTNINSSGRWTTVTASKSTGGGARKQWTMRQFVAVAAADDDGSIYRVFKDVDPNLTIMAARIYNGAITSGTSYDLGIYPPDLNSTPYSDNCLGSALDLSSAHAMNAPLNALNNLAVADAQKKIWELLGLTETPPNHLGGVDICLTADTVGSAAGTILVELDVLGE